ncbi:MAG: hypothetical protein AAF466_12755 [Bacteroidota bacterium]
MDYKQQIKKLKDNVFLEKQVRQIEAKVENGEITESIGVELLQELADSGSYSLPPIKYEDWKELLRIIDESEERLKKSLRVQLLIALLEVPLFIVFFATAMYFQLFGENSITTGALLVSGLGIVLTHTFFIFRIYQQGATAIERFSEKRVGILFLRIAANPANANLDSDKLIDAGTRMFLGHHVLPAEPLSSQDFPKKTDINAKLK